MSSHSNPITIAGDEEVPRPDLGNPRLRRVPHRDYSYPGFESVVFGDGAADLTQSRERKRTKTEVFFLWQGAMDGSLHGNPI